MDPGKIILIQMHNASGIEGQILYQTVHYKLKQL